MKEKKHTGFVRREERRDETRERRGQPTNSIFPLGSSHPSIHPSFCSFTSYSSYSSIHFVIQPQFSSMEATIIVQPASFFHQVVQSRRRYCFHQFQVGRMLLHGNSLGGDIARVRAVKYLRQKRTVQAAVVLETCYGAATCQGTGRPDMEDTYSAILSPRDSQPSFFGVFDGHGGIAVAEMLKTSLWPIYKENLSGSDLVTATISSYLAADQLALAQPKGFLGGLRERGLGGSRCGATAATAVLLPTKDGKRYLISANVGDARVVLSRDKCAIQLTVDHKRIKSIGEMYGNDADLVHMPPEVEAERKRIEAKNPTPKKPLVVNVGGTWRVGGLLALSRAFGDAYLKDWSDGKLNGARGGFGLTAEPDVSIETLSQADELIILGTDGLWEKLDNQEVVDACLAARASCNLQDMAQNLIQAAQARGSTDDISIIIVQL